MRSKKERLILSFTALILIGILVFSIFEWEIISYLFKQVVSGASIVKDYVLSLGVLGASAITLVIVVLFFFPIISSVPVQLASAVSYGLPLGVLHVSLSIFLASQLAFLFTRSAVLLSSEKRRKEHLLMEEKIKNSKRSIYVFLLLAYLAPFVPFLLIHTVAASSGMKWWKYALITLLGPLPDVVITLWAGVKITTSSSPLTSYIILLVIIVCVVVSIAYKDRIIDFIFAPKEKKDE
jgi:uncharacterized membrane protein YdjX (TVP38/TMEM64 family)